MKKSIEINLGGRIFNIDDDAYELLNEYIESLRANFKDNEEGEEIVADIELRLGELCEERMHDGRARIIDYAMVAEFTERMGRPDSIADVEEKHADDKETPSSQDTPASDGREPWRDAMHRFVKENIYLIICTIIAFVFVASIRSGAQTMRIFYGAEFFALLLLLRIFYNILQTLPSRVVKASSLALASLLIVWAIAILPLAYHTGVAHKSIFEQYHSDEDGIIFLQQEETSPITENWVMDIHHIYYEAPESEWRAFVVPLVDLGDTLAIPTPLIARNADMSYQLYNKYIQILPWGAQEAIESPATFFTTANKVEGNNPFYITRDSSYVIAPLSDLPPHAEWQWQYKPASWRDPSASLLGWLKRVIAPHTLPLTAPMQFPDTVTLPDTREYVIYVRPPYNTLQGIEAIK